MCAFVNIYVNADVQIYVYVKLPFILTFLLSSWIFTMLLLRVYPSFPTDFSMTILSFVHYNWISLLAS